MTEDRLKAHELWVQTPHIFILDQNISDAAFRLGCLLAKYAGRNGCAFPKQRTLATDLGWSLRKVSGCVKELRDTGWLTTRRRTAGGQCNYYLASPEERQGYAGSCVGVTQNPAQQEGDSRNLLPSEGPHAPRTASRRPSRRAEAAQRAAEEAAYDPARSTGLWDDEAPPAEEPTSPEAAVQQALGETDGAGAASGTPWGVGGRQAGTQSRRPGPDTGPGLARHWRETVGAQPWAFGLEANVRALASHFVKLKGAGLSPDEIREMSVLYATTEGLRNPRALAWQDFIGKRAVLLDTVRKGRESRAQRENPEGLYEGGWSQPAAEQGDEWKW
ncbi:helix-turn-helix domain-containing protein [Streptomyces sp. NPDC004528]|uniref:helix-turn-helix domain-containing protein n=1 Tax=Streptomyces sp. NPDC004528 TaxID=3154550 RepID=UPI0033A40FBF